MLFKNYPGKKYLLSLAASFGTLFAATPVVHADSVVTDPVGFVNTTINGTGGTSSSAITIVGLSVTQPVSFQGTVGSYNGSTKVLTPTNGSFTTDQFNGANGVFFVEVTSGTQAGLLTDITATSTSSITTADNISSAISGGESFKIRKHWTLQSVFGPNANTGNLVILGTGPTSSAADEVLLYDRATSQYVTYYYKVGGVFGGDGWRSTSGGTPLVTDVSGTALRVTDGAIVRSETLRSRNAQPPRCRETRANAAWSLTGAECGR